MEYRSMYHTGQNDSTAPFSNWNMQNLPYTMNGVYFHEQA